MYYLFCGNVKVGFSVEPHNKISRPCLGKQGYGDANGTNLTKASNPCRTKF
jgi:hypothetical protein